MSLPEPNYDEIVARMERAVSRLRQASAELEEASVEFNRIRENHKLAILEVVAANDQAKAFIRDHEGQSL